MRRVVLKYNVTPNEIYCTRCKATRDMPTRAMEVTRYVALMHRFAEAHRNCKARYGKPAR